MIILRDHGRSARAKVNVPLQNVIHSHFVTAPRAKSEHQIGIHNRRLLHRNFLDTTPKASEQTNRDA